MLVDMFFDYIHEGLVVVLEVYDPGSCGPDYRMLEASSPLGSGFLALSNIDISTRETIWCEKSCVHINAMLEEVSKDFSAIVVHVLIPAHFPELESQLRHYPFWLEVVRRTVR